MDRSRHTSKSHRKLLMGINTPNVISNKKTTKQKFYNPRGVNKLEAII